MRAVLVFDRNNSRDEQVYHLASQALEMYYLLYELEDTFRQCKNGLYPMCMGELEAWYWEKKKSLGITFEA